MVADLLPIRFFPMKLSHVGFKHLELIVWVLSNVLLTVSFVQAYPFILKIRGLLSDASPKDFAAEVEKGLCWFHSSCESSLGAVCIHTCDTYVYIYIYRYIYMFIYLYIYTFFMSVNMLLHGFKAVCLQLKDIPFTFPASFISPSFGNPSGWVIFHVVIWCCSWKNMWPWQDGKDVVGFCSWSTEFWFEYDEHRRRCWQTHHLIWIKLHVQPDVNHNHKILLFQNYFLPSVLSISSLSEPSYLYTRPTNATRVVDGLLLIPMCNRVGWTMWKRHGWNCEYDGKCAMKLRLSVMLAV